MSEITFYGDLFLPHPITLAFDLPEHYVANLEAPFTNAEPGYPGKINLRGSLSAFDKSFTRKPLALCLANNHIMDYFEQGFRDTIQALEEREIPYFGAGYLKDNCNNPLIIEVAGKAVGFMGYVCPTASPVFATQSQPGCMPIDFDKIRQDIKLARDRGAEHIIVQLHWGAEQVGLPRPEDVKIARALTQLDVDLIIGHHSHCIQVFERLDSTPIFYGLGNWVFPAYETKSFYAEDGLDSRAYPLSSHEKNKKSLSVTYNLKSREALAKANYFDGERLAEGKFSPERYKTVIILEGYESQFARAFKWGKLKHIIDNYLASPKLPRPEHFVNLLRLARARKYD